MKVDAIRESTKSHSGMGDVRRGGIGDFIREQRERADVSLRQLSRLAGVSNPYLSQIERGLRKPSAEILQQIAKALRISAEQLYVQAGILEDQGGHRTIAALLADNDIDDRHKEILVEIYEAFRAQHLAVRQPSARTVALLPAKTFNSPHDDAHF
jgi:transcriptional regulator with XRE-family HTH domain